MTKKACLVSALDAVAGKREDNVFFIKSCDNMNETYVSLKKEPTYTKFNSHFKSKKGRS